MAAAATNEPKVIRDKAVMRTWSRCYRTEGKVATLVPTMGFLHEGHLSLVSAAAAAFADLVAVVVSIYVNPSQFAPTEDLTGDLHMLASTGVVATVFWPPDIYVRGGAATGRRADTSGGAVFCLEKAAGDGHETWIRV